MFTKVARRSWPLLGLALLLGCVEKRIVWSPDGRTAVLLGTDGLRLFDANGDLSEKIAPEGAKVAWFPDSKRLLVVQKTPLRGWREIAEHLTPERREAVEAAAVDLNHQARAFAGDVQQFEPEFSEPLSSGERAAVLFCLRDEHAEGMADKFGDAWEKLAEADFQIGSFDIFEVRGLDARRRESLFTWLDGLHDLRISPDGRYVAFVSGMPTLKGDALRLFVTAIEGRAEVHAVADYVAQNFDWTPDGRALVYAHANLPPAEDGKALRLGAVSRRTVVDEGGLMETPGEIQDLAGLLFDEQLRVRCLDDGRILFCASEVTLPATEKEMPQTLSLFTIDPEHPTALTRAIPRAQEAGLGNGLLYFELSPDSAHVSIPAENGTTVILRLVDSDLWTVEAPETDGKLRTIPVWRTSDELCLVVGGGTGVEEGRHEVALASPSGVRVLSKSWPRSAIRGFLVADQSEPAAATPAPAPETPEAVEP